MIHNFQKILLVLCTAVILGQCSNQASDLIFQKSFQDFANNFVTTERYLQRFPLFQNLFKKTKQFITEIPNGTPCSDPFKPFTLKNFLQYCYSKLAALFQNLFGYSVIKFETIEDKRSKAYELFRSQQNPETKTDLIKTPCGPLYGNLPKYLSSQLADFLNSTECEAIVTNPANKIITPEDYDRVVKIEILTRNLTRKRDPRNLTDALTTYKYWFKGFSYGIHIRLDPTEAELHAFAQLMKILDRSTTKELSQTSPFKFDNPKLNTTLLTTLGYFYLPREYTKFLNATNNSKRSYLNACKDQFEEKRQSSRNILHTEYLLCVAQEIITNSEPQELVEIAKHLVRILLESDWGIDWEDLQGIITTNPPEDLTHKAVFEKFFYSKAFTDFLHMTYLQPLHVLDFEFILTMFQFAQNEHKSKNGELRVAGNYYIKRQLPIFLIVHSFDNVDVTPSERRAADIVTDYMYYQTPDIFTQFEDQWDNGKTEKELRILLVEFMLQCDKVPEDIKGNLKILQPVFKSVE